MIEHALQQQRSYLDRRSPGDPGFVGGADRLADGAVLLPRVVRVLESSPTFFAIRATAGVSRRLAFARAGLLALTLAPVRRVGFAFVTVAVSTTAAASRRAAEVGDGRARPRVPGAEVAAGGASASSMPNSDASPSAARTRPDAGLAGSSVTADASSSSSDTRRNMNSISGA
jgi:hypothetical protein